MDLDRTIDLRGRTDLRQLVRLVYHAQGVLSTPNLLMHLAAALETRPGNPNRACVVIAAGAPLSQAPRYPTHQVLHAAGALPCRETMDISGSLHALAGSGLAAGASGNGRVDAAGGVPRSMHLIDESRVIRAVQRYFDGGVFRYLSTEESSIARTAMADSAARVAAALSGSLEMQPAGLPQGDS
jgi:hypothetical protein